MKLNELLDVLEDGTTVRLHDARIPLRFETKPWCIDDLRGLRCDEMTVMLAAPLLDDLDVYVELDWML